MTIAFTDKRCTIDVHQTSKGFSFEYGNKTCRRRNEEAVHDFFLKEYQANKLDTVKLRFGDKGYYLHFTLDEPERCTKRQLRTILAQECDGAWCEEKNGKQRFFVREGYFFSKIKELTQEEYAAYRPASTIQKAMKLALGALSLDPTLPSIAPQATGMSALLFSLMNVGPALAQMPAIGEFRINTNTTGIQSTPSLAALQDGSFIVAWQGYQTGDSDIYAQKYNATGVPIGSEFRINSNTTSYQYYPTIAALNDGGFVAVWQGEQAANYDNYGQKYNATGVPIGSEFHVNSDTTNIQGNPAVTALKEGGFVVAWEGAPIANSDIYGQRYDATGAPIGSEFRITTGDHFDPALAALKDGGFVMAWAGSLAGYFDIYGQRFNATGVPIGSQFRINTNTTSDQAVPALAALNDGGFVAAWSGLQTGDSDIYGQRYNATGFPIGSEFRINTNTTGHQTYPALAALNDGGFVAAWSGVQTGDSDIYGQRYDAAGLPIGSEFRINTKTTYDQANPALAALNDGGFVVAWNGQQVSDAEIYGQRFDANGMPVLNASLPFTSINMSSMTISTTLPVTSGSPNPSTTDDASTSMLQAGSSSSLASQITTTITSTPIITSSSDSQTSTSQAGSSVSMQTSSLRSSLINSPSYSQSPTYLSIVELTYGTDYTIYLNGISVGTFTITGGTGLYDGTQSNTLILQLDPDTDLVGQTITLFTVPSDEEGEFQTIELQGVSCLGYDTQTMQDDSSKLFQVTIQITTCSTASKPTAIF